jgi:UDP-GlcNAc:undecaprenyl-phosphate GlcNAc-1-phosphate transferase
LAFTVLWLDVPLSAYRLLFAGILILVIAGVLDDLRELTAQARFGVQILAALIMALGAGVCLHNLGCLAVPGHLVSLGILAVPVTVFATVGVINAVNMSDGIDGLAASLVLIVVCALSLIAAADGRLDKLGILIPLAGVLLAFLMFNLRLHGSALVFMGDSGSMFLGFVLTWFLVQLSQGEDRLLAPVTALWLFALPLIDTIAMMLRRVILGRSPFLADREHFHHILMSASFTAKQTLALMIILGSTAAGIGLAGHYAGVAEHWMFLGFIALFALHFWVIMRAWRVKRFLRWPLIQASGADRPAQS